MEQVRVCLEKGRYKDTFHAMERKRERRITLPDIIHILRNGVHEKAKDTYSEEFKAWKYAIRGKTIDDREIRVIVSFNSDGMLIITAMYICLGRK